MILLGVGNCFRHVNLQIGALLLEMVMVYCESHYARHRIWSYINLCDANLAMVSHLTLSFALAVVHLILNCSFKLYEIRVHLTIIAIFNQGIAIY